MVKLYDSYGNYINKFPSWTAADAYRSLCGRRDWPIVEYYKTKKVWKY